METSHWSKIFRTCFSLVESFCWSNFMGKKRMVTDFSNSSVGKLSFLRIDSTVRLLLQ